MIYEGSELFKPVADKLDLRLDQLNLLIAQIMAIGFGLVYRSYLPPSAKNTTLRHVVAILGGFAIGYFFYGYQLWHVFFQVTVCFLALDLCPRNYVHLFIFTFCMSYLSALHLYRRFYDYANYTLDVTTQMMIMTQKLTALGFAFYDGMRPVEKLNDDQKSQAIKARPHIIEFLSYCFNFQGIIVGPLCYYQAYIQYGDGTSVLKHQKGQSQSTDKIEQPSVLVVLTKKLLGACAVMFVWFKVASVYPIITNLEPEMLAMPIWYRFLYFQVSAGSQRTKFYIAWLLGDAVNNASGFGFNGYDKDGEAKWDLVTNIDVIAIEKATSIKTVFDRWNIQTQLWLRRIAYDRLHTGKTLGVFVLSAFWHGFYPGYYFCFIVSAFFVYAGRGIRRKIRPFFQANQVTKLFYSFITWLFTIFCINYAATAFDLYETEVCIRFYNSWYWCLHIASITILLVLPGGSTKKPRAAAATTTPSDASQAPIKSEAEIKQAESKSD